MRTPDEYKKNLDDGIITEQMLCECLFCVNKRAKNHRDAARSYSGYRRRRGEVSYSTQARKKRDELCRLKDRLLKAVEPTCMHREVFEYAEERFWEYESGFKLCERGEYEEQTRMHERLGREMVCRIVRTPKRQQHYLFYEVGDRSFHSPINEKEARKRAEDGLEVIDIDRLDTTGWDVAELVSVQFARKVADLIETGDYRYVIG